MPDMMCATDPVDVEGHLDIEFHNVLREHREYLKKLFPFSRHLLSGSSRNITAARFNGINSSSPTSQFIGSFRPQRPDNGTFITASTHSHPSCRKYCSYNTTFLLPCLVFWTDYSGPCSPDSVIGIIVHSLPKIWIIIEKKFIIIVTFSSRARPALLQNYFCVVLHILYFCVVLYIVIFLFYVLFVSLVYVLLFLCCSTHCLFCVVLCIVILCCFMYCLFLCCSMYCLFCVVLCIVCV